MSIQFDPTAGILKRRLLIAFLTIALLVAGVLSLEELSLQAYSGVTPPSVQVITQWPSRSTTEVEQQITIPIENVPTGMPDMQSFRSVSLFGLSVVTLKFKEGTDSFKTRQDFSQYLTSANLPTGMQSSPSPDSDMTGEVTRFRLEGDDVDLITFRSYQDYDISKGLRHVQGVADISSFDDRAKEYHVVPSPTKLLSYGITLSQLITAIGNANSNTGDDLLRGDEQQSVTRGVGLLQTVDDIHDVMVAASNGVPVRVRGIAEVEVGNVQRLGQMRYNDQPDIVEGIILFKRDANAAEVLTEVREKVMELNDDILPRSVQIKSSYDRQMLLDIMMGTAEHTLVVGIMLVLATLFIFLGNFRAVAVVAAVTPLMLRVSFISVEHFHVLINLISLGTIDFEVIVDATMIVTENIMRHLEKGTRKLEDAIVKVTSEVQRVAISSTGIITVAYSPLFFIDGVEGTIFRPMASTMGFTSMASVALDLTFVPTATSLIFSRTLHPHSPALIAAILRWYKSLLRRLIARSMTALAMAITALLLTLYSVTLLGTEFPPTLEENNLWLRVTLPNMVNLEYSASAANDLRTYFIRQPKIQKVSMQVGRPDDGTDSTGMLNQEYGLYFIPPDQ